MVNESLIKYLAGLMDADGSLSFSFRRDPQDKDAYFMGLDLSLASSDEVDRHGFVDSLPDMSGMGGAYRYGSHSQYKAWRVSKRADLEMLLPRLIKHMVIKAQHWQWLLDTWRDARKAARLNGKRVAWNHDEMEWFKEAAKHSRRLRVGPLKPKKHPTWAWVAGYLDGDGWYTIRPDKRQNYTAMRVGAVAHQTDALALEFLQHAFGGSIKDHGQTENCKIWYRSLGVRDASFALRFLPKVARHSRLKRHKIDQLIHAHQQRLSVSAPAGDATV